MENRTQQRDFIKHLHAFRGFAIINIVAVHAFSGVITFVRPESTPEFDKYLAAANEVAFHDSTIYFALISGLLYSTVLAGRGWPKFYKGKLLNVFAPYVLISALLTSWIWPFTGGAFPFGEPFSGSVVDYLVLLGNNILTGRAMFHLWYMPVLAVLFLATPLIVAALKHKQARWLALLLVLAPLAISRAGVGFSIESAIYFLGTYAIGIAAGRDYDRWLAWMERNLALLVTIVLLATFAFPFIGKLGFEKTGLWDPVESLHYIHKLAIAGVALVLLKRWEARLPHWLDVLATYAFAIYFLHAVVVMLLMFAANGLLAQHPGLLGTMGLCVLVLVTSICVSMVIAWILRKLFGRRSRMIVGA